MSLLNLKTRRQAIKEAKVEKKDKRYAWKIGGHLVEVLRPKEPPGCCETSYQGGVFFDGKEVLPPGRLGNRVGFIIDDHHYQFRHNSHAFANPRGRKGGKFIFLVDGWEVDTRKPVNKFFLQFSLRILVFGLLQWIGGIVGILSVVLSGSIWTSFLLRACVIFIPLGLYYTYVGLVGVVKYGMRRHLDETGEPWWKEEVVEDEAVSTNSDTTDSSGTGSGARGQGRRSRPSSPSPFEPIVEGDGTALTAADWARIIAAEEDAKNADNSANGDDTLITIQP